MTEHRMILATADLSKIFKVVVARRKQYAGMAEEAMHHSRNVDYSCSTQDARSMIEESE